MHLRVCAWHIILVNPGRFTEFTGVPSVQVHATWAMCLAVHSQHARGLDEAIVACKASVMVSPSLYRVWLLLGCCRCPCRTSWTCNSYRLCNV